MQIGLPRACILVMLMDCGHKIAFGLHIGPWCRAWRVRNPFRIRLSDADFRSGAPRYRWPFGAFDRG